VLNQVTLCRVFLLFNHMIGFNTINIKLSLYETKLGWCRFKCEVMLRNFDKNVWGEVTGSKVVRLEISRVSFERNAFEFVPLATQIKGLDRNFWSLLLVALCGLSFVTTSYFSLRLVRFLSPHHASCERVWRCKRLNFSCSSLGPCKIIESSSAAAAL